MRLVDLVHLFLHLNSIRVALLGGEEAIISVPQGGLRMAMLEGREHFVAQDFVEALGHGGEGLQVRVVERPYGCVVEDIQVGLAEHQVDRVSLHPIGKALPRKNDAVAGETGIDRALDAVTAAVAEVGDDIRAGILVEGAFQLGMLPAAVIQVQTGTNLSQTADFEYPRQWARQGIKELVNHDGIKFISELAGWSIVLVVGDVPSQLEIPKGVGPSNADGDSPALGEGVDRES